MSYTYSKIAGPFQAGQRYNVFGLVTNIYEDTHLDLKSRNKAIVGIRDETVEKPYKVSIFSRAEGEQFPALEINCVIRFHRMRMELYQGVMDGRVFCGRNDIVVFPRNYPQDSVRTCCQTSVTDADKKRVAELLALIDSMCAPEGDQRMAEANGKADDSGKTDVNGRSDGNCAVEETETSEGQDDHIAPKPAAENAPQESTVVEPETHSQPRVTFLDTEPSMAVLRADTESKSLVRWTCICKGTFETSEIIWLSSPNEGRTLGSVKCPKCGVVGLATPAYYFVAIYKVEGQEKRRMVRWTGTRAVNLIGRTPLEYVFVEGVCVQVHTDLHISMQLQPEQSH